MRATAIRRLLLTTGALGAGLLVALSCSTDSPTAPQQNPGPPPKFGDPVVVASFEATVSGDANDLSVIFTNTSTGANSYLWEFGDGSTSRGFEPVHRYAVADTYLVRLTASNDSFSATASQFVGVGGVDTGPLTASFDCSASGLQVIFNNSSSGSPSSYLWDFGDGRQSSAENPDHRYGRAGSFVTSLTVRRGAISDVFSTFVTVPDVGCGSPPGGGAPTPSFVAVDNGDCTVTFTNTTTGEEPITYEWDFNGDGKIDSTKSSVIYNFQHAADFDSDGDGMTCPDPNGGDNQRTFTTVLKATNRQGTESVAQATVVDPNL